MYQDYLKRKEKVIITAIELLNERGIQGLTMKEIANRQGITEAAVYKHFASKRDIILTILEHFAAFDEVIRNTVTEHDMSAKEAIYYLAEAAVGYYQNYPELATLMVSIDVYQYDAITQNKMASIISKRHQFLHSLITKGQTNGELDQTITAEELTNVIGGLIWFTIFRWKLVNPAVDLKNSVMHALHWVLR